MSEKIIIDWNKVKTFDDLKTVMLAEVFARSSEPFPDCRIRPDITSEEMQEKLAELAP